MGAINSVIGATWGPVIQDLPRIDISLSFFFSPFCRRAGLLGTQVLRKADPVSLLFDRGMSF